MDQAEGGTEISKHLLNRRALIKNAAGFGAAFLGLAFSFRADAQGVHGFRNRVKKYQNYKKENPQPSQSWLDSILPNSKKQTDPASTPHPGLFQAANGSTEIGIKSRAYCIDAIGKGALELKPCLQAIEAMIPVANALGKLAEIDAGRLKDLAKTSHLFVDDCEKECAKHAAAHPALGPCANACAHLKGEIKTLLRA